MEFANYSHITVSVLILKIDVFRFGRLQDIYQLEENNQRLDYLSPQLGKNEGDVQCLWDFMELPKPYALSGLKARFKTP